MEKLVVLLLVCLVCSVTASGIIFVNHESTCTTQCGSRSRAFPNFKSALTALPSFNFTGIPTIQVETGVYTGPMNYDLTITQSVIIKTLIGPYGAVIDCEYNGQGFSAANFEKLVIIGLQIRNCSAANGGAILASGINHVELYNVILQSNLAFSNGGALYVHGGFTTNPYLLVDRSILTRNIASNEGGALYVEHNVKATITETTTITCNYYGPATNLYDGDLSCLDNTQITVGKSPASGVYMGVICGTGCFVRSSDSFYLPMCGNPVMCTPVFNPPTEQPTLPPGSSSCGDEICDIESESCLGCPADCQTCLIDGLKWEKYNCGPDKYTPSCVESVEQILTANLTIPPVYDRLPPFVGRLFGYFQVSQDGQYPFRLEGVLVGARLIINDRIFVDAYFQQKRINSKVLVPLKKGQVNTLEVQYFSFASQLEEKQIVVKWGYPGSTSLSAFSDAYYTIGNITSNHTRQYFRDEPATVTKVTTAATCGDGVCQESIPERCILDCFDEVTPSCPLQATPPSISGPYGFKDTIGDLIKNQYLYRFPGLEAISHGVDILTGEPLTTPLFSFSFCDNTSLGTVQDTFYGLTYTIPPEVSAQMATKCSFNSDSSTYSSSSEISSEMAASSSLQISAQASTKIFGVNVGLQAAFSLDKSVSTARSMESTKSGSLVTTEVRCQTSKVQVSKYTFHPQFIRDVANALTPAQMLPVIQKYGSHYYKSAVLGGKLKQVTIVDFDTSSSMGSYAMKQSAQVNFAASVSNPSFSASGTFQGSLDTDTTQSEQFDYEESSTTSSVLTYGGPPGSYSPAPDDGASTFGSWATGVSALPVPIDYELDAIGNIIPLTWSTPNGTSYQDIWAQAEIMFYNSLPKPTTITDSKSAYVLQWQFSYNYNLVTLPYNTDMATKFTIKGKGATPCTTTLMDKQGPDGTFAIAQWDAVQAVGPSRRFDFNCSRFSEITSLNVTLLNAHYDPIISKRVEVDDGLDGFDDGGDDGPVGPPNPTVPILQADGMVLYDFNQSRSYTFRVSGGSGYANLILTPNYTHKTIRLRFTATCTNTDNLHPNLPDNQTPVKADYDQYVLRIKGTLDEMVRVFYMDDWPQGQVGLSKQFDLDLTYDKNQIGTLRQLIFQSFTSRAKDSITQGSRNPSYTLSDISLAMTLCPDGISQTPACRADQYHGFTRIYGTTTEAANMTRKYPGGPVTFNLIPSIPTSIFKYPA